jgi:hypothetical protein
MLVQTSSASPEPCSNLWKASSSSCIGLSNPLSTASSGWSP